MGEIGTPLKNSQQAQLNDAVQAQSQEAGIDLGLTQDVYEKNRFMR